MADDMDMDLVKKFWWEISIGILIALMILGKCTEGAFRAGYKSAMAEQKAVK